jgi:dienelactone hydrolase
VPAAVIAWVKRTLLLAAAVVLLLAGCGGADEGGEASAPPATLDPELLALYDYEPGPLDVQEASTKERDGAVVRDLSYAAPEGRISAYYVTPQGDGPFPAVVFMHGSPGQRVTFMGEAIELAQQGIASVLPDAPFAREPRPPDVDFTDGDPARLAQLVVELRRAVDFLVEQEDVDASRLGYVGFSWGGSLGANFAGVERRVGSFVLISGVPRLSEHLARIAEERELELPAGYVELIQPYDAVEYLGDVAPNAVYFQFGEQDTAPTPEQGQEQFDVASEPKRIDLYDAGHELNAEARAARADWLAERFELGG